jgi:hypothetical protein
MAVFNRSALESMLKSAQPDPDTLLATFATEDDVFEIRGPVVALGDSLYGTLTRVEADPKPNIVNATES